MAYLKTDGSLDIERINKLPFEEYMDVMSDLTSTQIKEYLSNIQIKESQEPMQAIQVNYGRDDERSGVNATELIQNLRERFKNKQ